MLTAYALLAGIIVSAWSLSQQVASNLTIATVDSVTHLVIDLKDQVKQQSHTSADADKFESFRERFKQQCDDIRSGCMHIATCTMPAVSVWGPSFGYLIVMLWAGALAKLPGVLRPDKDDSSAVGTFQGPIMIGFYLITVLCLLYSPAKLSTTCAYLHEHINDLRIESLKRSKEDPDPDPEHDEEGGSRRRAPTYATDAGSPTASETANGDMNDTVEQVHDLVRLARGRRSAPVPARPPLGHSCPRAAPPPSRATSPHHLRTPSALLAVWQPGVPALRYQALQ